MSELRSLLVLCLPRSGSHSFCTALANLGFDVGHEKLGLHGVVSSLYCVDDDDYAGAHTGDPPRSEVTFMKVVHLVRHPLAVIASIQYELPALFWRWQERHTELHVAPHEARADATLAVPLAAAMLFYCAWLEKIEHAEPETVYVLENLGEFLPGRQEARGRHHTTTPDWDVLRAVNEDLYVEIWNRAVDWGYE